MAGSDLYLHEPHKFADQGLQLRVPVDMVPANQYSRLTNAVPIIEGRLEGRAGLSFIVKVANTTTPGSGLHSLTRLNQPSVAGVGDRIAGVDTTVQTYALPAGSVATSRDTARCGDPLSLPNFHFAADPSAWQIIADRSGMKKYKGGPGGGVYQNLGILPPSAISNNRATGADNGAGNLNSTGGPGYDWLYTYVNTITQSESNPSSLNIAPTNTGPTTTTTPDPGFGGAAGVGGGFPWTLTAQSATETRQSILFKDFAAGTPPFQSVFMQLQVGFVVTGGNLGGCVYGAVYMSLDGGTSWKLIIDSAANHPLNIGGSGNEGILISLSPTQDLTKIQVRAVALSVGNTTIPQNVTARRIRDIGGDFNLASLLTGGGGNAQLVITLQNVIIQTVANGTAAGLLVLVNRQALVSVLNPYDTQVDAIRLYRRGGSITAGWAFVQQYTVTAHNGATITLADNVADTNLGTFVQFNNDQPVTSVLVTGRPLPYIWGPCFNPSRLLGCGDPDRPDAVYFSNPGNADQWGAVQWVDVSSPSDAMQNGCVYNTRVFAFSKERMFELIQGIPGSTTITPFPTQCSRGLISPWGLISTARLIYFVAKDGIYSTSGGEEQSLVENSIKPLFPTLDNPLGRQIEGYDSVNMERIEDIRLRFHNDELYFFYRGTQSGAVKCLIYNQGKDRWRAASFPEVGVITAYSEEAGPASSLLLGDSQGSMYSTASGQGDVLQASTSDIAVSIRTGAFDQSLPLNQKEYGSVIFDIDPGGATLAKPITITPLRNGEVITGAALTVTGSGRQQIPLTLSDVFGFNIEFDIAFVKNAAINPVLYQFDILWRQEPIAVTHWEVRETSHGLPGWQHLRDMYVAYRSTTAVTLTMTFDNSYSQTYTLPSTAGKRVKTYIPFLSNKFKVAHYSFDSADVTQPFQLYIQDCEVRVKPWLTSLGYSVEKPFGAESTMATAAFESAVLAGPSGGGLAGGAGR